MSQIWILTIDGKYDELRSAHKTQAEAKTALYRYVSEHWENCVGKWLRERGENDSLPMDQNEAIEAFMDEEDGRTGAEIFPVEMDGLA